MRIVAQGKLGTRKCRANRRAPLSYFNQAGSTAIHYVSTGNEQKKCAGDERLKVPPQKTPPVLALRKPRPPKQVMTTRHHPPICHRLHGPQHHPSAFPCSRRAPQPTPRAHYLAA